MFVNRRVRPFKDSGEYDHQTDQVKAMITDALKLLELQPQCRWRGMCGLQCCLYHCSKCHKNALIVPLIQKCLQEIALIESKDAEELEDPNVMWEDLGSCKPIHNGIDLPSNNDVER